MSTEEDKCNKCKEKKIGYLLIRTQDGKESVCTDCLGQNRYKENKKDVCEVLIDEAT